MLELAVVEGSKLVSQNGQVMIAQDIPLPEADQNHAFLTSPCFLKQLN